MTRRIGRTWPVVLLVWRFVWLFTASAVAGEGPPGEKSLRTKTSKTADEPRPATRSSAVRLSSEQKKYIRLAENLVPHAANPVLDIGKPGEWDEDGFGCATVKKIGDTYFIWYGAQGQGKSHRVGVATSRDGIHWTKSPANPILTGAGMPYVLKLGDTFHMWFCDRGGPRGRGSRGTGICLATSADGITWNEFEANPLIKKSRLVDYDPCVLKVGDRFYMWHVGHTGGKAGAYRIGMSTSSDGIRWTQHPGGPVLPLGKPGEWDDTNHAVPCVLHVADLFFMWYLGHDGSTWRIGLATSKDGLHWTKSDKNPIIDVGPEGSWNGGSILGHDVIFNSGRFEMWFGGAEQYELGKGHTPIRIGYAASR